MKTKSTLKISLLVLLLQTIVLSSYGQMPDFPYKSDVLSGTTSADLDNYTFLTDDYTLEMTATAETEVVIPVTKYTSLKYTPTVDCTLRVVCYEGKWYAFEDLEYKGEVTTLTSVSYPEQNMTTLKTEANLLDLDSSEFPFTGEEINSTQKKLPEPWQISDTGLYSLGFRVSANSYAYKNGYAFVWRTDGSYKDKYFYQPLTNLTADSKYRVLVKVAQDTNGPGIFSLRLGSSAGGAEYSKATMNVSTGTNKSYTVDLTTPSTLGDDSYFSFYNEANTNVSNTNKACCQIDYIMLSEAIAAKGITGAQNVVYVTGAYGPTETLATAKERLLSLIGQANADKEAIPESNVGYDALMYPQDDYDDFGDAIVDAQNVYDDEDVSKDDVLQAIEDLEAAMSAFAEIEIISPSADQRFNFMMGDGFAKIVTFKYQGTNLRFRTDADKNNSLIQAFVFIPQDDINGFKIAFTSEDGTLNYMKDGGDKRAIRHTSDADEAAVFIVTPTEIAGEYKIKVKGGTYNIGIQDNGFYGCNSWTTIKLPEASKATAGMVVTDANWATFIAPFNVDIPSGVTAYSVSTVNDNVLELNEVNSIAANTPVILYSDNLVDESFEGWGQAMTTTYTDGLLTGTYVSMEAVNGTYILQKQDDYVCFFKVDTDVATPTVNSNRAYLSASSSGIKALLFPGGIANNINELLNSNSDGINVYTIDGIPVGEMRPGLNIIKTSDGQVYKVFMK